MARGFVTLAVLAAVMSIRCVVRHIARTRRPAAPSLVGAAVSARRRTRRGRPRGARRQPGARAADRARPRRRRPAHRGLLRRRRGRRRRGRGLHRRGGRDGAASRSARGAPGLAVVALAVSFLVSGVGNVLGRIDATGTVAYSAWPGWLTPLGWGYQLRPFGTERWWVRLLPAVLSVALLLGAGRLATRRDLDAGALPSASVASTPHRSSAGRPPSPGGCNGRRSSAGWLRSSGSA